MDFKRAISDFPNKTIAVIGDIMLDSYLYGNCDRLSPEAPVPIIRKDSLIHELGGAANVAANISSLGGKAYLLGYYALDEAGKILTNKLNEKNIDYRLFPVLNETTHKTRIIGNKKQQICRIDEEERANASQDIEEKLVEEIFALNPDIIIASDYAKGTLSANLFLEMKAKARRKDKRIIVDPRPQNKLNYNNVFLITPNTKEGIEMSNGRNAEEIGKILQKELNSNILLTRGEEGMTLFEKEKIYHLPTKAREVYDVTGAGDSVVAAVALSLASGLNLEKSSFLANHVAGIVVGKPGTATASRRELEQALEIEYSKIKNYDELKLIREDCKRKGKRFVWTNGCFDLLHLGHVRYLNEASKLGDYLAVGINSDCSVKALKGMNRPINSEVDRAEVLSSLGQVDGVYIFPELSVEKYLSELQPDVFVKGGDYNLNSINQNERRIIEGYGGKIALIPITQGKSTSNLIERIKNSS
ncbi:MAG: bifunctional heptose 7-phosphate kinase/heptose 1-phosphate adenyltransferase [Nanoarchaeota archaeon]|nr:bifunctional heptose 7-phosphate kinase/heptose 1-phosphate adenyltransferase [Nanoarchaeota archaeon]